MTPADRLTRAADTLDRMAAAADGSTALDNHVWLEPGSPHEVVCLIALTSDPVTVRLIAAWLRIVGAWEDEELGAMPGNYYPDAWQDSVTHALALADHINERSGS